MNGLLLFIKNHIKIIIPISLAGLLTITWFNIEKISLSEKTNIFNLWGTVQVKNAKSNENETISSNEHTLTNNIISKRHETLSTPKSEITTSNTKYQIPKINNSVSIISCGNNWIIVNKYVIIASEYEALVHKACYYIC